MADSSVPITAGVGTNIDTRTEATNGDHRQVVTIGDPSVTAGVAGVVNATPGASDYGVEVWVVGKPTIQGDVASGASDSGNPQKIGGLAKTTNPTAVADSQRVSALFDKLGKQVVVGAIRDLKGVTETTISASTSETTIIAQVAATFLDLYGLILANSGTATTKVTIKDSTAGTTRAVIEVPAGETRGFMLPVDSAIPQGAVNGNWTATCSVATTALDVTALWVKNI